MEIGAREIADKGIAGRPPQHNLQAPQTQQVRETEAKPAAEAAEEIRKVRKPPPGLPIPRARRIIMISR